MNSCIKDWRFNRLFELMDKCRKDIRYHIKDYYLSHFRKRSMELQQGAYRQKSVYTHKFLINTYRKKIECAGDWTSCMHNVHRVECSIGSIPRPSFCLQWYLNTSESYNAKSSKCVVQNIVSTEEKISWQRNQCCKIWECWYRIRG